MSELNTMQGNLFSGLLGTVLTGNVVPMRAPSAAVEEKSLLTEVFDDDRLKTWFSAAQISQGEARSTFVYTTDGRLWWRNRARRRRQEAGAEYYFRKTRDSGSVWTISIGDRSAVTRHMRRYLVWNWHFGATDRVLLPANGDTLDDRIENIVVGELLAVERVERFADAPRPSTGISCPCCGAAAAVLSPNLIARAYQLPPQQEAILSRVWAGKGGPVTGEAIIAEMYAGDPDGGPEHETARKYFKTQLCLLRKRIEGSGIRIETYGFQRGFRLVIEQRG